MSCLRFLDFRYAATGDHDRMAEVAITAVAAATAKGGWKCMKETAGTTKLERDIGTGLSRAPKYYDDGSC